MTAPYRRLASSDLEREALIERLAPTKEFTIRIVKDERGTRVRTR